MSKRITIYLPEKLIEIIKKHKPNVGIAPAIAGIVEEYDKMKEQEKKGNSIKEK